MATPRKRKTAKEKHRDRLLQVLRWAGYGLDDAPDDPDINPELDKFVASSIGGDVTCGQELDEVVLHGSPEEVVGYLVKELDT